MALGRPPSTERQPCMGANLSRCYPVHSRFPCFLGQLDMRRAQESVKGWPPLSGAPRAGQVPNGFEHDTVGLGVSG